MVCPFDRAQALEQRERDLAIAAVLAEARFTEPSLELCEECDRAIPEERRSIGGMTRCVPCQTTFEKGSRR